jgi:O-antigen ligase
LDQIRFSSGLESREKFNSTFAWLGVNEVAGFYAAYTFIVLGVFSLVKQKIPKMILGVLAGTNTYVLLFLFSRGAYAAFFAGACVFSILRKKWLLIPLFIIAISWKTLLPEQVVERIEHTRTEEGELDRSSERRIVMWEQSMQLFMGSPFIGSGFNTIGYLGFVLGDTHNIYVKFLAEQGIIGTLLLLMVFIFALRSGWRLYHKARDGFLKGLGLGFLVCVVSLFIANMFGDRWTYFQVGAFFWAYLAMVERGNLIVEEEGRTKIEDRREKGEEREAKSEAGSEKDEIEKQEPRVKVWKVKRGEKSN